MKTKIIYISGAEVFNMSDVRAAFDTVRTELGLGTDTVLFGVPVDKEDALGGQFEKATPNIVSDFDNLQKDTPTDAVVSDVAPVITNIDIETSETVIEQDIQENPEPKIKPKRTRKKAAAVVEEEIEQEVTEPEINAVEQKQPDVDTEKSDDGIISILSVLGASENKENDEPVIATEEEPAVDLQDGNEDILNDTTDVNFDIADIKDEIPTVEPEIAKIDISDDADDSLEKLLQSVQSLHEDKDETAPEMTSEPMLDETDLTLEKLANEFAENQDKIVNTTKSSARGGRIGKLKNILPFKKAKHNDSGIMGDLFGWAGVAANDEEFGIPEFFPTAAKK